MSSKSQAPAFRLTSHSTQITDYIYNVKLAVNYLREHPSEECRWQTAFDHLKLLNAKNCSLGMVRPFVETMSRELSSVASSRPSLALKATNSLVNATVRFEFPSDSKTMLNLSGLRARYLKMVEHDQQGDDLLNATITEPDSIKASEMFEKAGFHFMRSGFAVGALVSFTSSFDKLSVSAGRMPRHDFIEKQKKLRIAIKDAHTLAVSSNLSLHYTAKNLEFRFQEVVLSPEAELNAPQLVIDFYNSQYSKN